MPELDPRRFDEFFELAWGYPPFSWQSELARRVTTREDSPWPEAVALPTAAGKTACLDIAVFALAAQTDRVRDGRTCTAPRRIFLVVDRRVIVDEAYDRARRLSEILRTASQGLMKDVADRLRSLSGGDDPLECYQLRGGIYRSDLWARSPVQPAIIASTVDQFGSRLLFRGYGRSAKAWPIQAALAGNDSLVLLDEAHCAQPFLETLRAVRGYRQWADQALPAPFHAVILSATPPPVTDLFVDTSADGANPAHPLGRRQLATKPAELDLVEKAKGKAGSEELAKAMVERAERLVREDAAVNPPTTATEDSTSCPAVVVFCNRVDTARRAHALLSARHPDQVILLTGRMRPFDKDDTVTQRLAYLAAPVAEARHLDKPLYVVTTQTLEVGADLDFDLLVSECASLDSLRQRFGRLNRMGRQRTSRAVIVMRADQAESSETDPVYGASLAATWAWLQEQAQNGGQVDFGVAALARRLPSLAEQDALRSPSRHAPVLLPSHVDILVQSSPVPWPSPDPSHYLHGPEQGQPDVLVCWRSDLVGDDTDAWKECVVHCPPASGECLAVPIGQIRRWLQGDLVTLGADVEGGEAVEAPQAKTASDAAPVLRWRGRDDVEVLQEADPLFPGDVLVLPASRGGWDVLGTPGADFIADLGDRAHSMTRDQAILRLHPAVLAQWPSLAALRTLSAVAHAAAARLEDDAEELLRDLRKALAGVEQAELPSNWAWLRRSAGSLCRDPRLGRNLLPHPTGGLLLIGSRRLGLAAAEADRFSDEQDTTSSGAVAVPLLEHMDGVAQRAATYAALAGLPADIADVVRQAALRHDLGKADPRFQAWLQGGNPHARGPLLAKSGEMAQGAVAAERSRQRAGYPRGARHELLSVRLLESRPDLLPADAGLRDLLLHLVESHHGHARPFVPAVVDDQPLIVQLDVTKGQLSASSATGLERLDAGPAERFWRLTRRYGWWGLAWLEALLRLADHRQSEDEQRRRGDAA
jgi:CRISPR-associated endonuclease/helicase Cas3